MRFKISPEAVARLELGDGLEGREFTGPPIADGLMAGFTVGEIRWAKRLVGAAQITDVDPLEARILYYFLTVRRADHTLLPRERFEELSVLDFIITPHAVSNLDPDGDCQECSQPVSSGVHVDVDPTLPAAAEAAETT